MAHPPAINTVYEPPEAVEAGSGDKTYSEYRLEFRETLHERSGTSFGRSTRREGD